MNIQQEVSNIEVKTYVISLLPLPPICRDFIFLSLHPMVECVIIMADKHTSETHWREREGQTLCVNEMDLH